MTDEERYVTAGEALNQIAEVVAKTRELVEAMQVWIESLTKLLEEEGDGASA
jgi:hypothetical protein